MFNVVEKAKLVYKFDIEHGRPEYIIDNSQNIAKGSFHRIGYYLQLQHDIYGNQWIYTSFDTFTKDPLLIGIPTHCGKVFNNKISNLNIYKSDGTIIENSNKGKILMCAYNYLPIGEDLQCQRDFQGDYGCMQVYNGDDVLWAYNCHNGYSSDIGIGDNTESAHKDWTFSSNSDEYTFKQMKIYVIQNDISLDYDDELNSNILINQNDIVHGDTLIYNSLSKTWGAPQININDHSNLLLPNFIIAITGQACSQGYNSFYEFNCKFDQPHERIFGYNEEMDSWECADMRSESTGSFCYREPGWQTSAFHFARRLVESNVNARPGIINLGARGRKLCHWTKFERSEKWHKYNMKQALINDSKQQGEIYIKHVNMITKAMEHLYPHGKHSVDVMLWLVGDCEEDCSVHNSNYYKDSISKVESQYRQQKTFSNKTLFVICELVNTNLLGSSKYRKILDISEHVEYINDEKFINSNGQREIGTQCFKLYRKTFNSLVT
tara:strand:- start:6717 stop:8195 length:1479 start_codon:yes stop_codon:yes gene_type:complete